MSEKHGQIGVQWSKTGAATTSTTPLQKHGIFEAAAAAAAAVSSPYGLGMPPGLHVQATPADMPYTSSRFQAPPIHAAAPLTISPGSIGTHTQPQVSPTVLANNTPTNVPVPSGFGPPAFSNANVATSVMTPHQLAAAAGNAGLALVNAFGLNTAQQLELNKFMNAMNAAGAGAAGAAATANPTQMLSPVTQRQQTEHGAAAPGIGAAAASGSNSGIINSTIAENVMNALAAGVPGLLPSAAGKAGGADEQKMRRVQEVIEGSIDDNAKLQIAQVLERVAALKPVEKLFLYLRLPGESADADPLRQPQNPLGTRSEINHTINWVRSHLEQDPQVSIPKQDVYNDYIAYCERLSIKPLSTADFGKVMKQVFPGVRPRRLGTRGNSRYCYAAMRKATKLIPPQLPQLCGNSPDIEKAPAGSSELSGSSSANVGLHADCESWDVVRNWAEKLLNTKLDNIKDLAARIKGNNATANNANNVLGRLAPKKYTPREPKEKRLLADMGPLKKRRKKKRKGSSSSESSCNQLSQGQEANSSQEATAYQLAAGEEEQKCLKLVKIKQEIIDSPGQQQTQLSINAGPVAQQAMRSDNYLAAAGQQIMPMNLAKMSPTQGGAVRNLTPKILQMTPAALEQLQVAAVEQAQAQAQASPTAVHIKDEVEDYNTSNIFCKKVLKAQQTKGFWTNSPSSGGTGSLQVPPVITTTAATPPPSTAVAQPHLPPVAPATSALIVPGSSPVPLSMGPPTTQMNNASVSSVSPSSSLDTTAKVASRNMMLLRARRQMAAEAAEDASLPEGLGLPRERVISICNMDKHELDDYFVGGEEEENSEGPDTELLQYFQMGDAEEKQLNSLDAAEQNRNPQLAMPAMAGNVAGAAATTTTAAATAAAQMAGVKATATTTAATMQQQQQQQQQQLLVRRAAGSMPSPVAKLSNANATATTANVVGSASASLALMSRKHQQQQRQKPLPTTTATTATTAMLGRINSNNNKRKISLSNAYSNGSNKNCIFLPISPNAGNNSIAATTNAATTTTTTSSSSNSSSHSSITNASSCFASPGLTRMRQRSNLLNKQQSLDIDSCNNGDDNGDPMIGAVRKRRSFMYSYPTSTSASAPPSPSVLQQYMGANWSFSGNAGTFNDNNNAALLADQNSMDLETSLALDMDLQLTPLNETQRSQSVPLSQLQRPQSPAFSRQLNNASESLYGGDNSNSQQNDVAAGLLYEVDVNALISPSFNGHKFGSMQQQQHAQQTATTCSSSAGSSSGYSSAGGGSIISRSVPSTPLPHQQQTSFASANGNGNNATLNFFNRRTDDFNLSPAFSWGSAGASLSYNGQAYGTRNALDISKSMPTTPITTPCFRYSPELHRDFLINGNSIESIHSSAFGNAGGTDSLGTLIDDSAPNNANDVVAAMIGATDILDSL